MSGGAFLRPVATLASVIFAIGMALSGILDPARVYGFLDITRDLNPSLAFVRGGAVAVSALGPPATVPFVVAMLAGMALHDRLPRIGARQQGEGAGCSAGRPRRVAGTLTVRHLVFSIR